MGSKTTKANPKKNDGTDVCVVSQKVRNRFKEIIMETLEKQNEILLKRKNDLKRWGEKEKDEFMMLFGRNEESAKKWMLHGVEQMLTLNQRLTEKDFEYTEECVFANVNDVVDEKNKIRVGPKFFNAPLTGRDSRVVTLCHEFSHISAIMNTKDISSPVRGVSYAQHARKMVSERSREVMNNAYNIERYFE